MRELDLVQAALKGLDASSQLAEITNQGQIVGMIVLTQAEYDMLPDGKLTDGKLYMITGA